MIKSKREKGVTLVALIVTVVILLVVSGASIALVSGQGLFEKADFSRARYTNAQEEERLFLEKYSNEIDNKNSGSTNNLSEPEIRFVSASLGTITIAAEDNESEISAYAIKTEEGTPTNEEYTSWNGNEKSVTVVNNVDTYLWVKNSNNTTTMKKFKIHEHTGNSTQGGECYQEPVYHVHKGNTRSGGECYLRNETTTWNEVVYYSATIAQGATMQSDSRIDTFYASQSESDVMYSVLKKFSFTDNSGTSMWTMYSVWLGSDYNTAVQKSKSNNYDHIYTSSTNSGYVVGSVDTTNSQTLYKKTNTKK